MDKTLYKIIIMTDSDIGEYSTVPFLKETDFEILSSKFLERKEAYPLLLASILLVSYLPFKYNNYHIKEWLDITNKLYNQKTGYFIDNKEEINKILKNNNFVSSLFDNDKYDSLLDILERYIYKINNMNKEEKTFYMGNQTIKFVNNNLFKNISEEEKIIIKELEKEFGYEILTYNEMKKLAKKILNALNRK